jgi:hypothetical protein
MAKLLKKLQLMVRLHTDVAKEIENIPKQTQFYDCLNQNTRILEINALQLPV